MGIEDQSFINDVGFMVKHQTLNTWDGYRRSIVHQWCWVYGEKHQILNTWDEYWRPVPHQWSWANGEKHQPLNTWDGYRRSISHQWCWAYGEKPGTLTTQPPTPAGSDLNVSVTKYIVWIFLDICVIILVSLNCFPSSITRWRYIKEKPMSSCSIENMGSHIKLANNENKASY